MSNLKRAVQNNGKLVAENMEQQDYNKDGLLNLDGFEAALRVREIGLGGSDLKEAFFLVCNQEQTLAYQNWVLGWFPTFKVYFSRDITPRDTTKHEESMSLLDQSSMHPIETSINDRHNISN